jgi:2-polyprenyl-3-methyl-5-hydroxy-6-metoxy-1,4-benzoquinol methylase
MVDNQASYNHIAEEYAQYEWNHPEVLDLTAAKFVPYLPEGGKVLIVGCSAGRDSAFFIDKGFDVTSLDYSDELIKIARKRVRGLFLTMNLLDIDEEANNSNYDGLYCGSALQHLNKQDFPRALHKFNAVLKMKAHAFISLKEGKEGQHYETDDFNVKRTYCLHEKDQTIAKLNEAGFTIVEQYGNKSLETYKPSWMNFIVRKD